MRYSVVACFLSFVAACDAVVSQINLNTESVDNEYIVKLASPRMSAQFTQLTASNHYVTALLSTHTSHTSLALLRHSSHDPLTIEERLEADFGATVTYVTRNYRVHGFMTTVPSCDSATCLQHATDTEVWGLSRISSPAPLEFGGSYAYTWSDMDAGDGVEVFVVDSGVYNGHQEFADIATRHGFVGPQLAAEEDERDLNGHGTHVAGIAAGKQYGAAKAAAIVSVKVLSGEGSGTLYDLLAGLQYIEQEFAAATLTTGERPKYVVNLSLGFGGHVALVDEVLAHGAQMGIVYVAAAGNSAVDACLVTPASSPDVITVGATNSLDQLAWFSNHGTCVDILAPGEDILSAGTSHSSHSVAYSGTSMAAPFTAGIVARYLSHRAQTSDVTCVRQHLQASALTNQIAMPWDKLDTPNLLLFAECNTCFGASTCEPVLGEDLEPFTLMPLPEMTTSSAHALCDVKTHVTLATLMVALLRFLF